MVCPEFRSYVSEQAWLAGCLFVSQTDRPLKNSQFADVCYEYKATAVAIYLAKLLATSYFLLP